MIEPELPAEHVVDKETVRMSIALSYVKAWQKLPPGPGDLLASVLPVLASRDPGEDLAIKLSAEALGGKQPDANRKAWKGLKKTACAVHRAKVRHIWYRWNPETEREHRCFADLVWATEIRVDPVQREIELVFWPGLIEYLPLILGPIMEFKTRPPKADVATDAIEGLTGYFYGRQG
ncbi:MAG: hypothetical protein OXG72_03065 [Acidobacteria bacterium]|nr:hypothetical protein [Acidobacteriota bacterium]